MPDLTSRLEQLTTHKRALLMQRLRESAGDGARLVAYVVPHSDSGVDPADLRHFLQQKLPDYAVPSAFVVLDALPRTSTGKVDRRALPAPDRPASIETGFVAPRTPAEETLAGIWSEVLGVDLVGIHDNFFEIGGDSILSIHIVARARQAGMRLTPSQFFQLQTIEELAAFVETEEPPPVEQGAVTGPGTLTPIQYWFFEQPFPEPHHWNQTLWLEGTFDPARLEEALCDVMRHHDSLRLRFVREDGGWTCHYARPDTPVPFARVDLSNATEERQRSAQAAATLQSGFELSEGPLMRAALFDLGSSSRLLIDIHHLIVDLISWQILVEDLETAYGQRLRGEDVSLPPRTSSYKSWSEALVAYAQSDVLLEESRLWHSWPEACSRLPREHDGPFTEASARSLVVELNEEETRLLLHEVPSAYNTQTEDVLLAAIVRSLEEWTGESSLLVGLERHGREEIVEGLDLSRTVGWFTSYFPILLSLEGASAPGAALTTVKEQLRKIPRQGIGFGVLRYLSRDHEVSEKLKALPEPEVLVSYAGRAGSPASGRGLFRNVETLGISRSPLNRRAHLLEITAFVENNRLRSVWTYSENIHRRETIERLTGRYMQALRSLMDHCLAPETGGYTPSDFPEADLNQEELDRLVGKLFA